MTVQWKNKAWLFVLVLLELSSGCGKSAPKLYTQKAALCGTFVQVTTPDRRAFALVFPEMRRLCKAFNFYDSASELSRINASFDEEVVVSDEMIEVLLLAKEVHVLTEGAFDVSSGALYAFWKDSIHHPEKPVVFPSAEKIRQLRDLSGMGYIDIDARKKTVRIRKKGIKIDLSGIAKGYCVDKAIQMLKQHGVKSCLINSGGEIYCLGALGNNAWRVGIHNPLTMAVSEESVALSDAALATSGGYEQFFTYNNQEYSHIINPKTGYPVTGNLVSATARASTLAFADALATAFFVMGKERVSAFVASRTPKDIQAVIIEKDASGTKTYHYR